MDNARDFIEAKNRLAQATGLPVDNVRLTYLTTLTLKLEQMSAAVIAGEDVSVSELTALRSMIEEMTPPEPTTVSVKFCETITGVCPKCNARIENYVAPPAPQKLAPTIDAEPIKQTAPKTPVKAPAALSPPPRRNPGGSIHAAQTLVESPRPTTSTPKLLPPPRPVCGRD